MPQLMICDVSELLPGDTAERRHGPETQESAFSAHTHGTQTKLKAEAKLIVSSQTTMTSLLTNQFPARRCLKMSYFICCDEIFVITLKLRQKVTTSLHRFCSFWVQWLNCYIGAEVSSMSVNATRPRLAGESTQKKRRMRKRRKKRKRRMRSSQYLTAGRCVSLSD